MSQERNGNAIVWHRPEFIERLDELGTFADCGAVVGDDGARTVSKWHTKYTKDTDHPFPEVVCAAGTRSTAKKYLVKAEFATWLVEHLTKSLEEDEALLKRTQEALARVKNRVGSKSEDLRVALSYQEKWSKRE